MNKGDEIQIWVTQFADSVIQQTEALRCNDYQTGNAFAERCLEAFQNLRRVGNAGRDALVPLLAHPRADVRVMAASFLLRYRSREALAVLRAEARGDGLASFGASEAIQRWQNGEWQLDPE